MVFCAFYGLGCQMLSTCIGILLLSQTGLFHPEMGGDLYVSGIVLYALSSGIPQITLLFDVLAIGGFFATRLYVQMGGTKWAWTIILTALVFALPFFAVACWVNSVALYYHSTMALPFLTILEVLLIHIMVGLPLYLFGGILGKRMAPQFEAPCRTANAFRQIPPIPFYRTLPFQMAVSGFLPFRFVVLFYLFLRR